MSCTISREWAVSIYIISWYVKCMVDCELTDRGDGCHRLVWSVFRLSKQLHSFTAAFSLWWFDAQLLSCCYREEYTYCMFIKSWIIRESVSSFWNQLLLSKPVTVNIHRYGICWSYSWYSTQRLLRTSCADESNWRPILPKGLRLFPISYTMFNLHFIFPLCFIFFFFFSCFTLGELRFRLCFCQ